MNLSTTQKSNFTKSLLRSAYRQGLGMHVMLSTLNHRKERQKTPKVFFGGARSGDAGGPLVKVKRLRQAFNEYYFNYNLLYVLSNAPYLPKYAYQLIKSQNIPIIQNQNGVFYKAWYQGDWRQENTRMSVPHHLADYVFYQSEFCKKAANKFLGERQGKSEILYNAVDTNHFKPDKNRTIKDSNKFTFLLSGRIGKHLYYRLESTLRGLAAAIAKGLDARLIISGGLDNEVKNLSFSLINELGLTDAVTLTGPYTQNNAPSIYNNADAYVMTKHNDPCPNAVIEALSCGLPVLYSDTGGVPELVGDEAGVAMECEQSWEAPQVPDINIICDGMLEIAENHKQMSMSARNRALEKFDIKHWIGRHKKVFENLLENE